MRIATAIVNWNNADIRDITPWIPYEDAMDRMVAAGYDATEWGPSMPTDAAELGSALSTRGMDLIGAFVGLDFRSRDRMGGEIDRALEIARFLAANGATKLIAAEAGDERRRGEAGHVDESRGLTDPEWRSLADGLDELARRVQPLGMEVVFHNHVGTYVETPVETVRLLEMTDPALVGWCLDMGHLAYGGGSALDLLPRFADRVRHVHVKDVDPAVLERARAEGWSFREALRHWIFPPLGRGLVPIPAILEAVRAAGYDGWVVVEQDTSPDPDRDAVANRELLARLLGGGRSS